MLFRGVVAAKRAVRSVAVVCRSLMLSHPLVMMGPMSSATQFPTRSTHPAFGGDQADRSGDGGQDHQETDAAETVAVTLPDGVVALNDSCALYHTLASRITGIAHDWPTSRLDELEDALRDRFGDFLVELPDAAVDRLISLAAA